MDTPFQATATMAELSRCMLDDVSMKRFGTVDEIREPVPILCSDGCGFMTADTVYISGGGEWR